MKLYDLIRSRRSVRQFEDRPIPEFVLNELLDAAVSSPSGGNIQPLSIIVVTDPEVRLRLSEIVGKQPWVKNAPVSLVFCLDYYRVKMWAEMFGVEFCGERTLALFLIAYADLMCAAQTVTLLAHDHGLGSVYVGTVQANTAGARRLFETPSYVLPLMVLSLGYPRSIPSGIPKLARSAVVHRDKYRVPNEEEIRAAFAAKYGQIDEDLEKYFERAYREVLEADSQGDMGWVERAKDRMSKLEIKSSAEFLFKLRYPTEQMARLNSRIIQDFKNAGFDFSE